jgi:glyoxylase-like metal-dependent hydrolase (beta-lactamase superfamily II)
MRRAGGRETLPRAAERTYDGAVTHAAPARFVLGDNNVWALRRHAGLAARWAAEGARIVCGRAAVPALVAGRASNEAQREARLTELRRHGVPDEVVSHLAGLRGSRGLRWAPCPAEAIEAAEDRPPDRLADGRTLRLVPAPGHTPGNLVVLVEETRELFSGDTLLATTIPTPGLHFPDALERGTEAPLWPSLPPFLRSVAAIRALGITRVYPGHGEVVEDATRLIDQFEGHHARRGRKVREALARLDAPSAFEIARTLFPRLPAVRLGQAMTEVLGHLDVLIAAGAARPVDGDPVRWRTG